MSTSIVKSQTSQAGQVVNAVCVAVEDLGEVETPYGKKPQIKFAFETDQQDEFGRQRLLVRYFNKYTHPKSALSIAAKAWCGSNLEEEEAIGSLDWESFVDQQARLKIEPTTTKSGKAFDRITEFYPPGSVAVTPSGRYEDQ